MTLSCLLSRPWLIPYAEGDPHRLHGDVFASLAWRHLDECPQCRSECARLRATGSGLQAASRADRRRNAMQDDLSSTLFAERVMARVLRDEHLRRQLRLRERRRFTAALSLGFALAGLGFAFTLYGPPSLAQSWFTTTFHTAPAKHVGHRAKKKPPFAMHDPFGVLYVSPQNCKSAPEVSRNPLAPRVHLPIFAANAPVPVRPIAVIPATLPDPMAPSASMNDAREATIAAEETERERWEKARAIIVPSPNGARLAVEGVAPSRVAARNAPPLLLANAEASPSGANPMRAKTTSAFYSAPQTDAGAVNQASKTEEKLVSPEELRSLGLAPSSPPAGASPPADLGAPSSEGAP